MTLGKTAEANHRRVGQSDSWGDLSAIVAIDEAFRNVGAKIDCSVRQRSPSSR